jgi:hypothetical protein
MIAWILRLMTHADHILIDHTFACIHACHILLLLSLHKMCCFQPFLHIRCSDTRSNLTGYTMNGHGHGHGLFISATYYEGK